ncbi:MAG: hypothetical protein ACRCYP_02310 [Alphaproteobacteria bacterium]
MFVKFVRQFHNPAKPELLNETCIWQKEPQDNSSLTEHEIANGFEIISLDDFGNLEKLLEPLELEFAETQRPIGQPRNFSRATFDKYKARFFAVGDIMAQICAENEARLLSGEWTLQKLQTLMSSPHFANVFMCLQSLSFPTALQALQAIPETLIEATVKQRYIDILKEKMK